MYVQIFCFIFTDSQNTVCHNEETWKSQWQFCFFSVTESTNGLGIVICNDMALFQDEPEEKPRAGQPRAGQRTRRLFGDEPEERSGGTKRPLVSRQAPPCLFQDEPEEMERCQSTSSRGRQVSNAGDQQSSSDDEGVSAAPTLSVGWSAMHMFAKAKFMNNVSECGKPKKKARPYDNSKRIAKAAEVDQGKSRTYKESALDPQRLKSLMQSTRCKCSLHAYFACAKSTLFIACISNQVSLQLSDIVGELDFLQTGYWFTLRCQKNLFQRRLHGWLREVSAGVLEYGKMWARLFCTMAAAFGPTTVFAHSHCQLFLSLLLSCTRQWVDIARIPRRSTTHFWANLLEDLAFVPCWPLAKAGSPGARVWSQTSALESLKVDPNDLPGVWTHF